MKEQENFDEPRGDVHVVPADGPVHLESANCFCSPKLVYVDLDNGNHVWSHNDTRNAALQ